LIGLATVTAGGGGAPPCGWRSPQLATKVASTSGIANFPTRSINENDELCRVGFMNSRRNDVRKPARPHTVASDLCPPRPFGNSAEIIDFSGVICRRILQAIHGRTAPRRFHNRRRRRPR